MDNILKNPTFITVVIGTLTYTYLSWKKNKNKKNKKKKNKNNNDLLYAFIVSIIVWFISYGYINHKNTTLNQNLEQIQNIPTYKLVKELSESPKSFTLMNKGGGLVMPLGNNPLPEVFIDNF
jgi:hypothetical protein